VGARRAGAATGTWLAVLDAVVDRGARGAEWVMAASYLVTLGAIAAGVAATGGPHSPFLAAFVLPLLLANRFRRAVTLVGLGVALCVLVALALVMDAAAVRENPSYVGCVATAMVCVILVTFPVGQVEGELHAAATWIP
jgi:hypothetical protein